MKSKHPEVITTMKMSTNDLVLCALCAAVTCILAPLSVPLAGEVPISLATFAVLLSGILLGAKFGALSQLIYVLLGSVGVPVFAGWTGGIGITLGMTGGYIIGYIPMAFVAGLIYYRFGRNESGARKYAVMFAAMFLATAVLYILGTAWFMVQTKMTLAASLAACVIPFLPGDLIKIIAVMLAALPIEVALKKAVPLNQGSA
jgi:biotin transport system substrate-specific component